MRERGREGVNERGSMRAREGVNGMAFGTVKLYDRVRERGVRECMTEKRMRERLVDKNNFF